MGDSTKPADGHSTGVLSSERLDSWKEIAAYLRRTERTARRWEKTEALPVFRHMHTKRDSVYAYKTDLDAWLRSRRTEPGESGASAGEGATHGRQGRLAWLGAFVGASAIAAAAFWPHASTETPLAEPFKITPLTSHAGFERYSSFSPDGRHVAFSWRNDSGGPFHIHTKAIESGRTVQRTSHHADDLSPAWSPDGHFIAFLRSLSGEQAQLVLIPASGGPERELTEISRPDSAPSSVILFGHDLGWSPDSRFLVVPSGDPPKEPFGLLLVSIESGATRRLLAAPPGTGSFLAPAVSPDGRHLAFVRRTDFAVSEIWMNALSGDFTPQGEPTRMTYGNQLTTSPVWAGPRELLYLSGELGAEAGLYRMSIGQTGTPRPMPSLGEGAALLSVLPASGSPSWPRLRLGFTRVVKDHNIYRTESSGPSTQFSASRLFSSSTRIDFNPQFSPDGRRITFESTRSGSMEVWVANEDGSRPTQLTHFGGPLTGAARWSPDGRQIVFNSRFGGQADLYTVSANGGGLRRLTFEPTNEDLASWSRDGRWLYFHSDRNGSSQIWRMPADGGEWIPVTTLGGLAALESIDGKFVYYTKGKALGPASLWRVAKDGAGGGGEVPVLDSLADWSTFSVAPDGIYFIPYAKSDAGSSINFYRFADGQRRAIGEIHKPVSVGLTVSPDGRVILYTQVDRDDNDLVIAGMLR